MTNFIIILVPYYELLIIQFISIYLFYYFITPVIDKWFINSFRYMNSFTKTCLLNLLSTILVYKTMIDVLTSYKNSSVNSNTIQSCFNFRAISTNNTLNYDEIYIICKQYPDCIQFKEFLIPFFS
jgi:hypothetical protein